MTKKNPVKKRQGKKSGSPDEVHDDLSIDRGSEKQVDERRKGSYYYDDDNRGSDDDGTTYRGMI